MPIGEDPSFSFELNKEAAALRDFAIDALSGDVDDRGRSIFPNLFRRFLFALARTRNGGEENSENDGEGNNAHVAVFTRPQKQNKVRLKSFTRTLTQNDRAPRRGRVKGFASRGLGVLS